MSMGKELRSDWGFGPAGLRSAQGEFAYTRSRSGVSMSPPSFDTTPLLQFPYVIINPTTRISSLFILTTVISHERLSKHFKVFLHPCLPTLSRHAALSRVSCRSDSTTLSSFLDIDTISYLVRRQQRKWVHRKGKSR